MLNLARPSPAKANTGFTLIELMVTVAVLGILMALAMPNYTQWIANTRVRTTAEAIQNGLMLAKGEAVRRNAKVQFVLTNNDPVVGNVNTVTAAVSGKAWMVRTYLSAGTYTSANFIQGRSSAEGSANTTVDADQSTVVFTGMAGLSPVPAATVNIDVTGTGASRPLRITIARGGAIRMCDPNLAIATTTMGC
jgi:type IV fimbrial biogenesis protein FimT